MICIKAYIGTFICTSLAIVTNSHTVKCFQIADECKIMNIHTVFLESPLLEIYIKAVTELRKCG